MLKIPDPIEVSPELRAETERHDEIVARKAAAESKAKQLDQRIRTGATASERDAEVERVLANEPPQNLKDEFEKTLRDLRALEDAELQQKQLVRASRDEACRNIREGVRPYHDKLAKKMASLAVELHGVWVELYAIKTALLAKDIGLTGLFDADPQRLLGSPLDRACALADFMRDCVRRGFLASLPKEYR